MSDGINAVVDAAKALAPTDPTAAIAMLEQARDRPDFLPHAAAVLVRLFLADDRPTEALGLSNQLWEGDPTTVAGWLERLALLRGGDAHAAAAAAMLARLRMPIPLARWMQPALLEVLLTADLGGDATALVAHMSSAIDPRMARNLLAAIRFLAALRTIRDHPRHRERRVAGWTYILTGPARPALALGGEGLVEVNLSRLRVPDLDAWEPLARPFAAAIASLLGWTPHHHDEGLRCWAELSPTDSDAIQVWRVLATLAPAVGEQRRVHVARPASMRPGELWVRGGNVEFWTLRNYLLDPAGTLAAAETAARLLVSGQDAVAATAGPWWPRVDPVANIVRLATNAGWYAPPGSARAAYADWATRYRDGLVAGGVLTAATMDLLGIAARLPDLRRRPPAHWNERAFLKRLDGARLVLVTPFADEIARHHASGGLERYWRDLGIAARPATITTVPPPMSIWPDTPAADWSASFVDLRARTDAAITASDASLFAASCGGYGVPLTHAVHQRHAITSLYNGHIINLYFGVRTRAFDGMTINGRTPDRALMIDGRLEQRHPHIARIDKGRYAGGLRP